MWQNQHACKLCFWLQRNQKQRESTSADLVLLCPHTHWHSQTITPVPSLTQTFNIKNDCFYFSSFLHLISFLNANASSLKNDWIDRSREFFRPNEHTEGRRQKSLEGEKVHFWFLHVNRRAHRLISLQNLSVKVKYCKRLSSTHLHNPLQQWSLTEEEHPGLKQH